MTAPNVYLLRFSTSGYLPQDFSSSAPNLSGAINAELDNPSTSWWQMAYSEPGYAISPGSYVKTITINDPTLSNATTISGDALSTEMEAVSGTLPDLSANAIYVIILKSNQSLSNNNCYVGDTNDDPGSTGGTVYLTYEAIDGGNAHCKDSPNESPFASQTHWLSYVLQVETLDSFGTAYQAAGWVNQSTGTTLSSVCAYGASPSALVRYDGASYALARIWSKQARACLATPLGTTLTASFASSTTIKVSLTVQGHSESGQSVNVSSGGAVIASGVTNAAGRASLALAPMPSNTAVVVSLNEGPEFAKRSVSLNSPATSVSTTTAPATS
jgi:hypothetical protein